MTWLLLLHIYPKEMKFYVDIKLQQCPRPKDVKEKV